MEATTTLKEGMVRVLAGTLVLRCKARFFAWSVGEGIDRVVRDFFYQDYDQLDGLCDDFARRINQIGGAVPGAYSTLAKLSSVKEDAALPVRDMIAQLAKDHDQMRFDCEFLYTILEDTRDEASVSLLVRSTQEHEDCSQKLRQLYGQQLGS